MEGLVDAVLKGKREDATSQHEEPRSSSVLSDVKEYHASPSKPRDTPAARTGPPRTISHVSQRDSPHASRSNSRDQEQQQTEFPFTFRGALDEPDRKGKKRDSKALDEGWTINPMKWFADSERPDSQSGFMDEPEEVEDKGIGPSKRRSKQTLNVPSRKNSEHSIKRSHSEPQIAKPVGVKWGRLKSLVTGHNFAPTSTGQQAVKGTEVNITDELIMGGLATLMLRLWFERDEKGQRRIPILFHRLRIRISDSLHPLHGHKSVFRIECSYGNSATARFVVYRTLRDFLSLHTHYTISNAYTRNLENLPEFPKHSLPYFKFLKNENKEQGREKDSHDARTAFARRQREALETYLIDLIRSVMFHPEANRLAGFLEISALSIQTAQRGGHQYKGGFLKIDASNKGGGFGRKAAGWNEKKESRWCVVGESYLVVMEEPGELAVWDVFLLDSDFKIERPKRYYRQGLNLLHSDAPNNDRLMVESQALQVGEDDRGSKMGSVRSKFSKISRVFSRRTGTDKGTTNGSVAPSGTRRSSTSSSPSSDSSVSEGAATPMLDPSTNTNPLAVPDDGNDPFIKDDGKKKKKPNHVSKHTFYIENAQMRLKLYAKNERQMLQWITALEKAAATSHWTGQNRFDSFAPIRLNVAAQWLVDGRDYMWNLSRAILLARETIHIHDWWLSPELQMRRPNKGRYRLDNLLERKAKEGVKIYIILYQEVSNRTTPTDSNYTKQRLTSLHPNIMVQRSPSHFQTGTFYWAHHEKMCVIDSAIAFIGGVDLCFGRWDTPQHVLVDDPEDEEGTESSQIWPGKDYSNPRILDFHTLNRPDDDMYDRGKVPRMPWHDVGMQVVGQPARDLVRHFVQRWNYLLRIKNHSRVMPFLVPPAEFKPGELSEMGLTGTCEMQICRSAGPWSMGTPARIEHSIQNAYLKAIQMSEHFVYIENQFFISSTVVNDVKIENKIGDALVHRIIRAHAESTPWKCCIMVPLLPGFAFPVDHSDASAIRIILECQNRTMSRGPNSIFGRIRKEGIDPDDYISFFCLRNWAKMKGDVLTTEMVYIHGKVCIVDDRLAIIGSANINERSQRGDRDSELAAIVRDTDMIECTMAGKPFKVGRFAHTLRIRLMREHLGIDVDNLPEDDLMANDPVKPVHEQETWDPDTEQEFGQQSGVTEIKPSHQKTATGRLAKTVGNGISQAFGASAEVGSHAASKGLAAIGVRSNDATTGDKALDEERMSFSRDGKKEPGFASSMVPTLEEKTVMDGEKKPVPSPIPEEDPDNSPDRSESSTSHNTPLSDSATTVAPSGQHSDSSEPSQARTADGELYGAPADASKDAKMDNEPPHTRSGTDDADSQEQAAPAARNTLRKHLQANFGNSKWTVPIPRPVVDKDKFEDPICDEFWKNTWVASASYNTEIYRKVFHAVPDDLITTWKQYKEFVQHHERLNKPCKDSLTPEPVGRVPSEAGDEAAPADTNEAQPESEDSNPTEKDSKPRTKSRGANEPFEKWEREEMEKLLGELNGPLVIYPTRFLEGEDVANNFLFNADRLLPLPIYN